MKSFPRPPMGGGAFRPRGPRFQRRDIPQDAHRINERIMAQTVRVVVEDGEQLGILDTRDALVEAQNRGLDLVEIAPQAQPPVCKIMDYGKFKYREQKKEAEAKKKRSETETKELKMSYKIDVGDFNTKLRHAREFIEEGDKVKFNMRFRGREAAFMDRGVQKFNDLIEQLSDIADIDERSPSYGNLIYIVFAPKRAKTP